MRELKFRQAIFHPVTNEFLKWHHWGLIDDAFVGVDTGWVSPTKAIENSQVFTTLPDKNGIEIYEGDKARVEHPDNSVPMYDRYGTIFKVEYTYGMFVLKSDNYTLLPARHFAWGEIEVIGNIHESKELEK